MSKIDINIDGLKKNADTIAAKKQELQTLNKNLENLIKEINDKWGRGGKCFLCKYAE